LHAVVEDDPSVITLFVGAAMTVVPGIRSHADTDVGAIPDLPRLHDPCELDPVATHLELPATALGMKPPAELPTVRVVAPAPENHSVPHVQRPRSVHRGAQRLTPIGRVRCCALRVGDGSDVGVHEPGRIEVRLWNLRQDRPGHGSHLFLRSVRCLSFAKEWLVAARALAGTVETRPFPVSGGPETGGPVPLGGVGIGRGRMMPQPK